MTLHTTFWVTAALTAVVVSAGAAELERETLLAWDRYIAWTEHCMRTDDGFLVQRALPESEAREARRSLERGDVFTTKLETKAEGRAIDVPDGLVHHWLGSVFVPSTTVDELVRWLQDYDEHHRYFDEVEASRLVSKNRNEYAIFLRLRRKKIVTVHYNTEHLVRYTRHAAGRVASVSYSTRIAELQDAGEANEREKPVGDDRGFLWRLNSYWRFQQASGGVIVELESVSLSRGVPVAVRWLVGRYLDSVPRESLEATLLPIRREAPKAVVTEDKRTAPGLAQ